MHSQQYNNEWNAILIFKVNKTKENSNQTEGFRPNKLQLKPSVQGWTAALSASLPHEHCSYWSISPKIMTTLNKIKKTKLKTATRAHTSYTTPASCSLEALCWDVVIHRYKHTRGRGWGPMGLCSKRKFPRSKKAFLNVLVFLLLLEMTHRGYILNICKVVWGPVIFQKASN